MYLLSRRRFSVFETLSSTFAAVDWHSPSFMAGESAEAKEKWLVLRLSEGKDQDLDAAAFFIVIDGWARSGANGAAQKAEKWLVALERRHSELMRSQNQGVAECTTAQISKLGPTIDCYNSVILAWARSGESIAVVRAERWLSKAKQLGPNTDSYNYFLDCISKGCSASPIELLSNAKKADQTLREMINMKEQTKGQVEPNTESFNFVLRSWTRCRREISIANKVMGVLRAMELYQRSSDTTEQMAVKPNTVSYSHAMDAWVVVAGLKAKQYLGMKKEHSVAKSGVFSEKKGNGFSNGYEEIGKAESILKYMDALQVAGADVEPDTVSYNIILGGYVRVANAINTDAPLRAERVLRQMVDLQSEGLSSISPDQRSYVHVIRCWAKIKRHNSGERCEWWLRKMWQEFDDTGNEHIRPNTDVYNAVMSGYEGVDAVKVDNLLTEMLDLEQTDNWPFRPNTNSFSLAMRSWLKDGKNNATAGEGISHAFNRLQALVEREAEGIPQSSTSHEMFAGILKAASKGPSVNEATLDIVVETYEKFQESRHPVDDKAYVWLLQAGLTAMSGPAYNSRRTEFIRIVTKSCCDNGLLSNGFVVALANSPVWNEGWTIEASNRLTKEHFGSWPLPLSWSRNIKNKPRDIDTRRRRFQLEDDMIF